MRIERGEYGGDGTIEKLDAMQRYADRYTMVLKDKPKGNKEKFTLHYVDAFANNGSVTLRRGAFAGQTIPGSVPRALNVSDKPFDRVLLIDNDAEKCRELRNLVEQTGDSSRVDVRCGDANVKLREFALWIKRPENRLHRAFVFIDPYAMTVDWDTLAVLASTKRCDVLMLFPLMAIRRQLTVSGWPDREKQAALNRFFGGEYWRELYSERGGTVACDRGYRPILSLYVQLLLDVFIEVVEPERSLGNPNSDPRFTLLFAASNETGAEVAARIAEGVFKAAHGPQMRLQLC